MPYKQHRHKSADLLIDWILSTILSCSWSVVIWQCKYLSRWKYKLMPQCDDKHYSVDFCRSTEYNILNGLFSSWTYTKCSSKI